LLPNTELASTAVHSLGVGIANSHDASGWYQWILHPGGQPALPSSVAEAYAAWIDAARSLVCCSTGEDEGAGCAVQCQLQDRVPSRP